MFSSYIVNLLVKILFPLVPDPISSYPLPERIRCHIADVEQVEYELDQGLDVNTNDSVCPLLHSAILVNQKPIVDLLIRRGVDIHKKDTNDDTPLHYTAYDNRYILAKILLVNGASLDIYNDDQKTPLDIARESQTPETSELVLLFEHYKSLQARVLSNPSSALLEEAIKANYPYYVIIIVARGIPLDQRHWDLAKQGNNKEVGQICKIYLSLISPRGLITKKGIIGLYGLPQDIAREIARWLVCAYATKKIESKSTSKCLII